MLRTFNYGIGLVVVVPPEQENDVLLRLQGLQEEAFVIGDISERKKDAPPVVFA
jgi:phosphoribosylformylglycinamidine cyclo-ligase